MIRKITLDNFMAHVHTEVELGAGVTALTGPNNIGKSAVVEALRCVATNPAPRHFIRHGAKEARVTVELEDGTRVIWIRKKLSPGYEIWAPGAEEPQEFYKMGRGGVPDEVRAVLRLDEVGLETGRAVDVHIGNQREPIFLLNNTDSDVAAFFAASTESAHLLAMQNLLKRRITDAKRREQEVSARRRELEGGLDRLALLPDLALAVEQAADLGRKVATEQAVIPALEGLLARRGSLQSLRDHAAGQGQALAPLAEPPALEDTRGLYGLLTRRDRLRAAMEADSQRLEVLENIAGPPDLTGTNDLTRLKNDLENSRTRRDGEARLVQLLSALKQSDPLADTAPLTTLLASHARLRAQEAQARVVVEKVERELAAVRVETEGLLGETGHCPTCGAALTAEDFLDRGCGHD